MPQMKLFGNSRSAARVAGRRKAEPENEPKEKKQKKKKPLKVLAIWLTVILCLEGLYFFLCYTQNSFVKRWRTIYIQTAMSTMRHQWMATYLLPEPVIDEVLQMRIQAAEAVGDKESSWSKEPETTTPAEPVEPAIKPIDTTVTEMETETMTPEDEQAHNGILATTCSGFIDIDSQGNWGNGNGGLIAGYAMSNGHGYGTHYVSNPNFQYYRLEIHTDNLIYIKKVDKEVSEDCRDATEFQPPIIIDGEVLQNDYWVELNPRVCIGQSDKYEMLLLVIEGRLYTEGILGTDVNECAKILQRHNAVQAMNVDGGTSAMMWYDGEYVIRGSNAATRYTGSRPVPNAFVYHKVEE